MTWIAIGLIGGLVGLDATSFPQAMWSRPLVAGTAVGLILGRPAAGLLVGIILEIFALLILPFGAARYPESGTAAAAAAAAYAVTAPAAGDARLLLLAVVFALTWERIAGASVIFIRRLNERLVARPMPNDAIERALPRRHLLAVSIDFVRGIWAVLLGSAAGILLLRAFGPLMFGGEGLSTGLLIVATAAMLGSALPLFGGVRKRWPALALGMVCGALVLLLQ
ncbi:MAG: PTS sugar transporter subunit IIC [Longimicrobiales bacterium]